jgi:hypothetical protein
LVLRLRLVPKLAVQKKTRTRRVIDSSAIVRRRAVMMRRWRASVMVLMARRRHMVAARYQTAMHPHAPAHGMRMRFGGCRNEGGCRRGQQHQ